ncbi:MAG: hypothetical protein K6F51_00165 [Acetatifactor sp.]|nr:hypothetical protein [Acetatifactor sp.]
MDRKEIQDLISDGENILWQGKPQFVHYVLGRLFSTWSVLSMVWIVVVFCFIWVGYHRDPRSQGYTLSLLDWGIYIFYYLFLTCMAWKYLGKILAEIFAYGNVAYVVTNLGVYASGGVFQFSCKRCSYFGLRKVKITHSIFDFLFKIGNVVLSAPSVSEYARGAWTEREASYDVSVRSISDFREVYDLVKSMEWNTYVNGADCNAIKPDAQQDGQKAEEWDWRQ